MLAGSARQRHLIWDWNGTLLDDRWLCIDVVNAMLEARRLPAIDPIVYRREFTFPVEDYYRAIGFDLQRESFTALSGEFHLGYEAGRNRCRLRDGARTLVEQLARRDWTQSVLSGYRHDRLTEVLVRYRLHRHFGHVHGLDDLHARSKLDIGRRQADALLATGSLTPDDIIVVGDTLHDAEVADHLGVRCVLVDGGHQARNRLESSGHPVVSGLASLADQLQI